jgi:hypothetical protein
VLVSVAVSGIAGLLGSAVWTWLRGAARAPSWFGFLKITHVRNVAAGVCTLTAAAGISLSTSDHSHREISYVAWYGAAVLAFVVVAATTIIIERSRSAGEDGWAERGGEAAAPPLKRPGVGTIHEQHLHGWLADLVRQVSHDSTCGYVAFPAGAGQSQQAVAAHFPDLIARLVEWDQAVARAQAAPDTAREQIERAVMAADVPPEYDQKVLAEIIARLVVARPDYRIVLRAVRNDFRESGPYWTVFTDAGGRAERVLGRLRDAPIEEIKKRAGAHEAALQALVDDVHTSDRIPEIGASRADLAALKQPLLDLLGLKQAVSPILFATDCSYCQAQLQPPAPPLAINA